MKVNVSDEVLDVACKTWEKSALDTRSFDGWKERMRATICAAISAMTTNDRERERLCKFLRNALHDDADKAADLLEADAVERAWRPMDTAPMDGTPILADCVDGIYIIWRRDGEDGYWDDHARPYYSYVIPPHKPLAWMPLPAAPRADDNKGDEKENAK